MDQAMTETLDDRPMIVDDLHLDGLDEVACNLRAEDHCPEKVEWINHTNCPNCINDDRFTCQKHYVLTEATYEHVRHCPYCEIACTACDTTVHPSWTKL